MPDEKAIQRGAAALYEHVSRELPDGTSGPAAPIWIEQARVVLEAAEVTEAELVEQVRELVMRLGAAAEELTTLVGPLWAAQKERRGAGK